MEYVAAEPINYMHVRHMLKQDIIQAREEEAEKERRTVEQRSRISPHCEVLKYDGENGDSGSTCGDALSAVPEEEEEGCGVEGMQVIM